jgi:outer membrane immunogenic protein
MCNSGLPMNKPFFVCAAIVTMTVGPALAADIPVKAPPPVQTPRAYDWSGAYIGFNIGGVWSSPRRFYPNLPEVGIPATTFTSHDTDGIYGVHAGVQKQWGQWVFGVEAAYSRGFNNMESSVSVSPPEPFTHLASTTKITGLLTVGPRIGYAWDRFMVYGTGGYAAARLEGSYSCGDTGLPVLPGPGACSAIFGAVIRNLDFGGNTWNNGWFAGAGIDFMAYQTAFGDVILGVEYQHFDVGLKTAFTCDFPHCFGTHHQNFLQGARGDIVRARLAFKSRGLGN